MLFASLFVKAGGDVTIKVDGIYYHYYDDEVTEVTEVSVAKGDEPYSGDIIVPSQITYNGKTYAVTSIHWFAFQNANLTSLQLPGTITSIEWGAFDGMTGLTSLVIPEGVTTIEGIGGIDLRRLTLPASLKQIRSFYGDNLEAVCLKSQTPPIILDYPNPDVLLVVPSDCRNAYQQDDKWGRMPWIAEGNGIPLDIDISFEENGFIYQIYSLVDNTVEVNNHLLRSDPNRDLYQGDIVIPKQFDHKGTTYIPVGIISIFGEGVTSISLPPTITHIRDRAFEGNWGMTSFTMEEGVAEIGKYAFADCHLLTSIRLPKSLLRLSSDAFANCFSFANIVVAEGNPVYSSPDGCNAIIENATSTLIIGSANTTVPEGILKIAPYAFAGNRSLTHIGFPSSLQAIGDAAFDGCLALKKVSFVKGLKAIGDFAFSDCRLLEEAMLPEGLSVMGRHAFRRCYALKKLSLPTSLTSINLGAFEYCYSLPEVVLPNTLTAISDMAFADCWSLSKLTIPEGTKQVGANAFTRCIRLKSVSLPSTLKAIGRGAFSSCDALSDISLPNGLESIDMYAFAYCPMLTSLNIPASVNYIGRAIVNGDSAMEAITVDPQNNTYDSRGNCNAIVETATNTLIAGCQSTVFPQDITSIGPRAFAYCDGITELQIPSSVTTIDVQAFLHCFGLQHVTLPTALQSLGSEAFHICPNIQTVTAPIERPYDIPVNAFYSHTYKDATLFVPMGCVSLYQALNGWQCFTNITERDAYSLPSDITTPLSEESVSIKGNLLTIFGLSKGDLVSIYLADGRRVRFVRATTDGMVQLSLQPHAIYIIHTPTRTFKVQL